MDQDRQINVQGPKAALAAATRRAKLEGVPFAVFASGTSAHRVQPLGFEPQPHNWEQVAIVQPDGTCAPADFGQDEAAPATPPAAAKK